MGKVLQLKAKSPWMGSSRTESIVLRAMKFAILFSYDTSFLKRKELVINGDVESNPGPANNNTPRGRKSKKRNFNFTPKKLDMGYDDNSGTVTERHSTDSNNGNKPKGLVNIANDCFFNSVIQALFALPSFRHHVENFNSQIPNEVNAVNSIKQLFRSMESNLNNALQTHSCLMSLNLPGYTEHMQFDAEECMTYLINLFYPRISDVSNPLLNVVPDDSIFLLNGEESVLCSNCRKYSNRDYRESLTHIEFPDCDIEYSVQMKVEEMTNTQYGQRFDELYHCENEHCRITKPHGAIATQARTLLNLSRYMIIQLKMFGYDQTKQKPYKAIPKLQIEEELSTILLGKLNLCAIVYHIGDSPIQGHYVAAVKFGDTWCTCNDTSITPGVKLNCDPANKHDRMIPYMLIYEKDTECRMLFPSTVNETAETEGNDSMVVEKDMNDHVDFSVAQCSQIKENDEVLQLEAKSPWKMGKVLQLEAKSPWMGTNEMNDTDDVHEVEQGEQMVSTMNRKNLLKELEIQSKKVSNAENRKGMEEAEQGARNAVAGKKKTDRTMDISSKTATPKRTKYSEECETSNIAGKFNFKRKSKFTDRVEKNDRQWLIFVKLM